eukprot:9496510-Pyramimonas_sp.AAC.1
MSTSIQLVEVAVARSPHATLTLSRQGFLSSVSSQETYGLKPTSLKLVEVPAALFTHPTSYLHSLARVLSQAP